MKITDKQKELLIKMRDEKLAFLMSDNNGLSNNGFFSYWVNENDEWDFTGIKPYHSTSIKKLHDKGLLIKKSINYSEIFYHHFYSINPIHQTFIDSL